MIPGNTVEIITDEDQKKNCYQSAKLAIVASGTATLQLSLSGCPMIVCYKLSSFTYHILKLLVKTKYISLVNIIMNEKIVPELIQNDCTSEKIYATYQQLDTTIQIDRFQMMKGKITPEGKNITQEILGMLSRESHK
jgi:lipid A disaccharide synthetase